MNIAAFADAVRDLVYLDLKTGEIDQVSDSTFLLIRGPADFAEEVTASRRTQHRGPAVRNRCAARSGYRGTAL